LRHACAAVAEERANEAKAQAAAPASA